MNVKDLIYKLLILKNSATFVLFTVFLLSYCNQYIYAYENIVTHKVLYLGPPVTTNSGSSGTGTTK